jgi:hypothetical protein
VKVVCGFEISNFRIQCLVHFYTRFWSFFNFEQRASNTFEARTPPRHDVSRAHALRATPARWPASAFAPTATQGHMPTEACSFPMRRAPRLGSPPGRAHYTDRAVPARCAPWTVGPSAAPRRTRTGQGGCATTASPSSRLRHRGGLPIKTERHPALRAPHQAVGRHCRPRAELGSFPRNRVDQPPPDRP